MTRLHQEKARVKSPRDADSCWVDPYSEQTATMTVMLVSVSSAASSDSAGWLLSSPSLKKLLCVFSWNSR